MTKKVIEGEEWCPNWFNRQKERRHISSVAARRRPWSSGRRLSRPGTAVLRKRCRWRSSTLEKMEHDGLKSGLAHSQWRSLPHMGREPDAMVVSPPPSSVSSNRLLVSVGAPGLLIRENADKGRLVERLSEPCLHISRLPVFRVSSHQICWFSLP